MIRDIDQPSALFPHERADLARLFNGPHPIPPESRTYLDGLIDLISRRPCRVYLSGEACPNQVETTMPDGTPACDECSEASQ